MGDNFFRLTDLYSSFGDCGELDLIEGSAVSLVDDGEAFMKDFFGLFDGGLWVPLVGKEGESEVFGEACGDVVLGDVSAEEIDDGEVGLAVLVSCEDEVVVEGILFVSSLVGLRGKVVGVVFDGESGCVSEDLFLGGELVHESDGLLKISEFSGGCDYEILCDLFESADVVVF